MLKASYVSLAQRIRRHNRQSEVGQGEVVEQMSEEKAIRFRSTVVVTTEE